MKKINDNNYVEGLITKSTLNNQIYNVEILLSPVVININKRLGLRNILKNLLGEINNSLLTNIIWKILI